MQAPRTIAVLEYVLPAGQIEPLHSHDPGVAYVINGATLHTRMAGGSIADGTLHVELK